MYKTAIVPVKSALASKINWIAGLSALLVMLNELTDSLKELLPFVPPQYQHYVTVAVVLFGGCATIIARTFFTTSITPSAADPTKVQAMMGSAKSRAPMLLVFIMGLSFLASGCATTQDPRSILAGIQYGVAIAEVGYEAICPLAGGGPAFCADNQASYLKSKTAITDLINTAAAAIDLSNDTSTVTVVQLLNQLEQNWKDFNSMVNGVKAKDAARRGITFQPIPLH